VFGPPDEPATEIVAGSGAAISINAEARATTPSRMRRRC